MVVQLHGERHRSFGGRRSLVPAGPGDELFENRAALTRGPLVAIDDPIDANSGTRALFWTGTLIDGTASATNCSDWTSYVGGATATVGRTDMAGQGWVDPTPLSCSKYLSLLCFEQ